MYIALEDRVKEGSTRLHMDLSDAINVLVYESTSSNGESGALWHIFSREDTILLREILKSHPSYNGSGDPIHQHTIYLTSSALEELRINYGIVPYEVVQHVRQSFLIPAGCAHQVWLFVQIMVSELM